MAKKKTVKKKVKKATKKEPKGVTMKDLVGLRAMIIESNATTNARIDRIVDAISRSKKVKGL